MLELQQLTIVITGTSVNQSHKILCLPLLAVATDFVVYFEMLCKETTPFWALQGFSRHKIFIPIPPCRFVSGAVWEGASFLKLTSWNQNLTTAARMKTVKLTFGMPSLPSSMWTTSRVQPKRLTLKPLLSSTSSLKIATHRGFAPFFVRFVHRTHLYLLSLGMKHKPGFYWLYFKNDKEWSIGEFDGKAWSFLGNDETYKSLSEDIQVGVEIVNPQEKPKQLTWIPNQFLKQ